MSEELYWLSKLCDEIYTEDWFTRFGVSIESMKDPGWIVKIDLTNTVYESISQNRIEYKINDRIFLKYWIENCEWNGMCGIYQLDELLSKFRELMTEFDLQHGLSNIDM